ncbi:hypothetical protein N431DRAFT_414266 [Stipitochalara longipes BDJ]|nr:hypothetical protein N431DRAFT_414266 [Stipitochalara longipes BDJ]
MSITGRVADLTPKLDHNLGLLNVTVDFSHSDFSLWKCSAPAEFSAVGVALSSQRRTNAEDGPTHKTARRLGALFEQLIPSTPKLLKAYGLRSSEIIGTPGLNPKGTDKDGPFEAYVGTDCTTIWAAATSGPASLGTQLLSCMLVRAWKSDKATSIWVELVAERQAEIIAAEKENCIISTSTAIAARQDISREELANWDASVRSWLRQADQVKRSNHNQFLLIIKNVATPFVSSKSTYSSVIASWTKSMLCMERLLNEEPQQVSDRAVLLALSAWHLYPDLVVYGEEATNVKFHDLLIPKQAILTLGLGAMRADCDDGVRWSLALSHLRYYGDPVKVSSNEDVSRVTIRQFQAVVLGAVFGAWDLAKGDMVDAARWIKALWDYLQSSIPPGDIERRHSLSWMEALAKGAEYISELSNSELRNGMALLGYGARRAGKFICLGDFDSKGLSPPTPFFGLLNRSVSSSLSEKYEMDRGVHYIRGVAGSIGLQSDEAFICFSANFARDSYYEYSTVIPHTHQLDGVGSERSLKRGHGRWIQALTRSKKEEVTCGTECHSSADRPCLPGVDIKSRITYLKEKGEACYLPYNLQIFSHKDTRTALSREFHSQYSEEQLPIPQNLLRTAKGDRISWKNPPKLFRGRTRRSLLVSNCPEGDQCQCLDWLPLPKDKLESHTKYCGQRKEINFRRIFQFQGGEHSGGRFELYIRDWEFGREEFKVEHQHYKELFEKARKEIDSPKDGIDLFNNKSLDPWIWSFIDRVGMRNHPARFRGQQGEPWTARMISGINLPERELLSSEVLRSLKMLQLVDLIYEKLPMATISLDIVKYPIFHGHWVSKAPVYPEEGMTRQNSFACIVLFETGHINLKPEDLDPVLALSIDNSIYVAGQVLSDPFDQTPGYDIRHLIGNIGHPGVSLMVGPQSPRVRGLSGDWRLVQHDNYDWKREDNFKRTSLHLSFTKWKVPLPTVNSGSIDHEVHFLESVISLCDGGEWVADLDILGKGKEMPERVDLECTCDDQDIDHEAWTQKVICLDNWEELLDRPSSTCIFRAHGNWAARLAAVSLLNQQGLGSRIGILGPKKICWEKLYMRSYLLEGCSYQVLVD